MALRRRIHDAKLKPPLRTVAPRLHGPRGPLIHLAHRTGRQAERLKVPPGPVRRQRRGPGGLVPGRRRVVAALNRLLPAQIHNHAARPAPVQRDGRTCATLVPRGTRPRPAVPPQVGRLLWKHLTQQAATLGARMIGVGAAPRAEGFFTGSHPKGSRRHGQPAPIVPGRRPRHRPTSATHDTRPHPHASRATQRQRPAPAGNPQRRIAILRSARPPRRRKLLSEDGHDQAGRVRPQRRASHLDDG